ncbi:uncharacterized protein I303_107870 [Kwoniella dejecticola CBS 10117]|uniref:DUF3533 domain-containing protein n=1 Tax=Kwoniella dejecticola CBS 10117 TaxID=1296121 RepID=A0A1A5ZVX5_9TREE|nr:uncharacterized protein I303_07873 [Kwoniella dejecticola CBS 10117]OBR81960.1 hypothetical protein I303_07873 [Kwoniella dejecticola CBS 10117]
MSPFSNSPSTGNVLKSKETPDGKSRVGFFSKELKDGKREWAKLTFMTFGLITVFMFLFLSIYFGSYFKQIPRATHFSIEVLDLDSAASPSTAAHPAILGPAMNLAISNSQATEPHLGWYGADASTVQQFRLTPGGQGLDPYAYAEEKVLNQDVWGVLIINSNATSGVWDGLTQGTMWEPTGAMTFLYEESRNFYAANQYVSRLASMIMTTGGNSAATTLASQILSLSNASEVLTTGSGAIAVSAPFSYNLHNLRPFDQLAGIASTTVGTVYLIIFTFLISITWNNQGLPLIQDQLTLSSEILVKLLVPFVAYFWLSLHYSLVSLAFLINFTREFGRGGFVLYWMADWITMSALGFVMETMFLWLGPFFPFFLIFWVILNVTTAFLDLSDMATFYRYGYFTPVWNLVDMAKCIIFGTKNHVVQNFAVNLGWLVVWMTLLSITVIYQRRNKEKAAMQKKWDEIKHADEKETNRHKPSH